MAKRPGVESKPLDTDLDRYPTLDGALRAVLQDLREPEIIVELIEIRPTASGELNYRYRAPRGSETSGGYVAAPSTA